MTDRLQKLFAATLGIALMFWLAWPGFFSFDSATQLAQARGILPLDDANPPLMALAWRGLERIWAYPGVMFAAKTAERITRTTNPVAPMRQPKSAVSAP